jgi:hypothetical protein
MILPFEHLFDDLDRTRRGRIVIWLYTVVMLAGMMQIDLCILDLIMGHAVSFRLLASGLILSAVPFVCGWIYNTKTAR